MPTFGSDEFVISINQNALNSSLVHSAFCAYSGAVSYRIQSFAPNNVFLAIDAISGDVTLTKDSLELSQGNYTVALECYDPSDATRNDISTLFVMRVEENEFPPQFSRNDSILANVLESLDHSTSPLIETVSATDRDRGIFGTIIYTVSDSSVFSIGSDNGEIRLQSALDFETTERHQFVVTASNPVVDGVVMSRDILVVIDIVNVDDEAPIFTEVIYQVQVLETTPQISRPSSGFFTVRCDDIDTDDASITYEICLSIECQFSDPGPFELNVNTGDFSAISDLDYETRTSYSASVLCFDNSVQNHSATARVEFAILPVNEHDPVAGNTLSTGFGVQETTPVGFVLVMAISNDTMAVASRSLACSDMDAGPDGQLIFTIEGDNDEFFRVNSSTGEVSLRQILDYELLIMGEAFVIIFLQLTCCDVSPPVPECPNFEISVFVLPENEFLPVFLQSEYEVIVSESLEVGSTILNQTTLQCIDGDIGLGAPQGIRVSNGFLETVDGVFLVATDGQVSTIARLDYETIQRYAFDVECSDGFATAVARVLVLVEPENDNEPMFARNLYVFNVSRTTPSDGYFIGAIVAVDNDRDFGGTLTYTVQSNGFFDVTNDGDLLLINSVLNVSVSQISFNANVSDGFFIDDVFIVATLTDGNMISPIFLERSETIEISELLPIGTSVIDFACIDEEAGLNGEVRYYFADGNTDGAFFIDESSGEVSVASTLVLPQDFVEEAYTLSVVCEDHGVPILSDDIVLLIRVIQDDLNPPEIGNDTINAFISEDAAINDVVVTIVATDLDMTRLNYRIENASVPGVFIIDPQSGAVTVAASLDREELSQYEMLVVVNEEGAQRFDSATLVVFVRDINDNAPMCDAPIVNVQIPETLQVGSIILQLNCTDIDIGDNAELVYSLDEDFNVVQINDFGEVILENPLNFTNNSVLDFFITVSDMGAAVQESRFQAVISIISTNRNAPTFLNLPDTISISEAELVGTTVFTVSAEDPDRGSFGQVLYAIIGNANEARPFTIFQNTGRVILNVELNFFEQQEYVLNISASDSDFTVTETLTISVLDENEFPPACDSVMITGSISENLGPNQFLSSSLSCSDMDEGSFGQLMFTITSGNVNDTFTVQNDGAVLAVRPLDFETIERYDLVVEVADVSVTPITINVSVVVLVQPVNEFQPTFGEVAYEASIPENAEVGRSVLVVNALDLDRPTHPHGRISYAITGLSQPFFSISNTGLIQLTGNLDRETQSSYQFSVLASDQGVPPMTGVAAINITVSDIDDNPPEFQTGFYLTSLNGSATSGTRVTNVLCIDADLGTNAEVEYSIDPQSQQSRFFDIDPRGLITVLEDLPVSETYTFSVFCVGPAPANFSATAVVSVLVVVDSNITFLSSMYMETVPEDAAPVLDVLTVSALSSTAAPLTYTLLDQTTHFSIDRNSGLLQLISTVDHESVPEFLLRVQASDDGNPPNVAEAFVQIIVENVNDNVPQIDANVTTIELAEGPTPAPVTIAEYSCRDNDNGLFGQVTFLIASGNFGNVFSLSSAGSLQLVGNLDFEDRISYSLEIVCEDGAQNPESDTLFVSVSVLPVNDNAPQFDSQPIPILIEESLPPSSLISTPITATDLDLPPHNSIHYSIIAGNTSPGTFFISAETGQLMLVRALDYELVTAYTLTVLADDSGGLLNPSFQVLNNTIEIEISVVDSNDNAPMLSRSTYMGSVGENAMIGDQVVLTEPIVCTDRDSDANGRTSLAIQSEVFIIENTNVVVGRELDFETASPFHVLTVTCSDGGAIPLTSEAMLFITILDVNEFGPEFVNDVYNFSVPENAAVGTIIGSVFAVDADAGQFGVVIYNFLNATGAPFALDSDSGNITLVSRLDYETQSQVYVYGATASDLVDSDTTTVFIEIENIDDNLPVFTQAEYFNSVPENAVIGIVAGQVNCTDADDEADGMAVTYSLQSGGPFQIESQLGTITVSDALDLETIPRYPLSVLCVDSNGNSVTANFTIDLLPFNDFPPVFINIPYSADVVENLPVGLSVFQVSATDNDNVAFNTIRYSFTGGNEAAVFSIDASSGIVRIAQPIDREQENQYELIVQAQNIIPAGDVSGSLALSATTTLSLNVLDENDNTPVITPSDPDPVFIQESDGPGTVVAEFTCVDADIGMNGTTNFSVISQSTPGSFEIVENGTLLTLDFIRSNIVVDITCRDNGVPISRSATVSITINTVSMNDHAPEFALPFYGVQVREDHPIGTNITCITATDMDGPDSPDGIISYSLELESPGASRFGIRETTGCIFAIGELDIEFGTLYSYTITATDMGESPQSGTTSLQITVLDVIRDPPLFVNVPYTRTVSEGVVVGTFLLRVTCTDPDQNDTLAYNIIGGNTAGLFTIDNSTGDILVASFLDFESATSHTLEVQCTDSSALQDTASVFLTVLPVNEHTPFFQTRSMLSIPEHSISGTLVTTLQYEDGDAGADGDVSFEIVSGNINDVFTVTDDGQVLVIDNLDRESRSFYSLRVQITDQAAANQSRSSVNFVNITVSDINDQVPMFQLDPYMFDALEGTEQPGYVVGTVGCTDGDTGPNAAVVYQLMGVATNESLFSIDSSSGDIVVVGDLSDREFDSIGFFVECTDSGSRPLTGSARVLVTIIEENLHSPLFNNASYSVEVLEDIRIFDVIVSVEATDRDSGVNGLVRYSLQDTFNNQFFIDEDSGDISILRQLDFETVKEYDLVVEAVDGALDSLVQRTSTADVFVEVIGVNEFSPICARPVYVTVINETVSGEILPLECTDDDDGEDGVLFYTFISGNAMQYFQVIDGTLTIPDPILPNTTVEQYVLEISVSDSGSMPRQTEIEIVVVYSFENFDDPTFDSTTYFLNVSESTEVGEILSTFVAIDTDPSLQGEVSYTLAGTQTFRINPVSGDLFLALPLDWELNQSHEFTVIGVDNDPFSPNTGSATVVVMVLNENDNPPECDDLFYVAEVFSNAAIGETVTFVMCTDPDQDALMYGLTTTQTQFSIDTSTGRIFVSELLTRSNFVLSVIVSDGESAVEVIVSIGVIFENIEPPVFTQSQYTFSIAEDAALLSSVGRVLAIDADSELRDVLYSVLSPTDVFYVNPFSGVIQLTALLNFETTRRHMFVVQVEDGGGFNGNNVLNDTATVIVNIENVNDNPPLLSSGGVYGATVSESVAVGTPILNISCTDGDDEPFGSPSIASAGIPRTPFQLVGPASQKTLEVAQVLEGPNSYVLNVSCVDGGGLTTSGQVFLFVPEPDAPEFAEAVYEWLLTEGSLSGSEYSDIVAVSNDGSDVSYSISDGNEDGIFFIDPRNGVVSLVTSVDYETQRTHGLIIRAIDSSNRQASVLLLVQVLDENDEIPLTPPSDFFTIPQNAPVGFPVGNLECMDADVTANATQFNFTFIPMSDIFSVDEYGIVRLEQALDELPVYVLPVVCFDLTAPEALSTGIVTIEVEFLNLEAPSFESEFYYFSVQEDLELLGFVGRVTASDGDVGSFGDVTYSIAAENTDKFFIDAATGDIRLLTALDRESLDSYNITVVSFDGGVFASNLARRTGTTMVSINVGDVNDNPPVPEQLTYVSYITTNHTELTSVLTVSCSDRDLLNNAVVDYSLEPETPNFLIQIDGTLLLGREQSGPAVYNLNAVCRDRGFPMLSSSILVTVIVDIFEVTAPEFERDNYNVTIPENLPVSSTIIQISAISSNQEILYSISAGNDGGSFHVVPTTGDIILIERLDARAQSLFLLSIEAIVAERNDISSFTTVRITVADINDNAPSFENSFYVASVSEIATLFSPVTQVACNDSDTNAEISYSITGGLNSTTFNITQEGILVVADVIDYETETLYTIEVTCNDGGDAPFFATTSVRIEVLPVNEFVPEFVESVYSFQAFENSFGSLIGTIEARDNDAGNDGSILYFLEDPGSFSVVFVEPFTGEVLVSNNLDYETQQVWNLTVIARDGGGAESHARLNIAVFNINDVDPVITPTAVVKSVPSDSPFGYPIQLYSCTDGDTSSTSLSIVNQNDYFMLSDARVLVWTAMAENLTSNAVISLTLTCQDNDAPQQTVDAHIAITIVVSDIPPPIFASGLYTAIVNETTDLNTTVVVVSATSENQDIVYSFFSLPSSFPFQVNGVTGDIVLTSSLDRETVAFYSFFVRATDEISAAVGISLVEITVTDFNDNAPRIFPSEQSIVVSERLSSGVLISFSCTDDDADLNGNVNFRLTSGNELMYFSIDSNGDVSLSRQLDFETISFFNITVVCFDGAPTPLQDTAALIIEVLGVNELAPQFGNSIYSFDINEYAQAGELVGVVAALDGDRAISGTIQYTITSGSGSSYFTINSNGEIRTTTNVLNATETSELLLTIRATDEGQLSDDATVEITVIDVNERPTFTDFSNQLVLNSTDVSVGTVLLELFCFDTDLGSNAELSLDFADAPEQFTLQTESFLKSISGSILLNSTLPAGSFEVSVQCFDSGSPSLSSNASVVIRVEGANSPPFFLHGVQTVSIPEDTEAGTSVISVAAQDLETNVTYAIIGGNGLGTFDIDADTGDISLILSLDYEVTINLELTVAAYDQSIFNRMSATTQVFIVTSNVNDIDPIIDPVGIQVITISESTEAFTEIKDYTCIDPDGQLTEFLISSEMSSPFSISQSGTTGSVSLQTTVDYETQTVYNLMIVCRDSEVRPGEGLRREVTALLIIHVLPVNSFPPTFISPSVFVVAESANVGDVIGRVEAVDSDGRGEISYSGISNTFVVDPISGNVSLIAGLDFETTRSFTLDVSATDNDNVLGIMPRSTTVQLTITVTDVNDNPPVCVAHTLQTQLQTGTYSYVFLTEVDCSDRDEGNNSLLTYSFVESTVPSIPNGMFILNTTTGEFGFTGTILSVDIISIAVNVSDSGDVLTLSSPVTIFVQVISTNLSTPHFNPDSFDVTISENTTSLVVFNGSSLLSALVNPANDTVEFALRANPLYGGAFVIDFGNGNIVLSSVTLLDFDEGIQNYLLIVEATVGNSVPSAIVNITLSDYNDNAPRFSQTSYNASVQENQNAGVFVLQVEAHDIDLGLNSLLFYELIDTIGFTINSSSGEISALQTFDREVNERYFFYALAKDMGSPQLTGTVPITVTVLDENDNPPMFTQSTYIRDIDNISPPGSELLTLQVLDADITNSFTFQILTDNLEVRDLFAVDSPQGILRQRSVSIPVDHQQLYNFTIEVNDGRHTDVAVVIVYVATVTSDVAVFEENVPEQQYNAAEFLILQEFNITSSAVYEIAEGDDFDEFRVYANGTLTTRATLDRENISEYVINIHIVDSTSSENVNLFVTVVVVDQNDNAPVFNTSLYNFVISEGSYPESTLVGTVSATDNDAPGTGASAVEYSFVQMSDLFGIDRTSGEVFVRAGVTLDREREDSHTLTARARDFGEPTAMTTSALIVIGLEDINDNDPEFVPVDVLEFVVEIDDFVSANTTLELIAILPGNNQLILSGFQFVDRDSTSSVIPSLVTIRGDSKFDIVLNNSNAVLITVSSITLEDNGTMLQIILRDEPAEEEQRPVVRNVTVFVRNATVATTLPPTTASTDISATTPTVAPTTFFETEIGIAVIVVICALIFALLFFFCTLGCYCYLRIRREKDPLRNR